MATKIEQVFRSAYNFRNIERSDGVAPSGSEWADEYGYTMTAKGKVLEKKGSYNLYEKIQEAAEETKIENILQRCVQGDTSMLRASGQFIDCTELPSNLLESMQQIQQLENFWEGLSKEVKEKYNWNVEQFIAEAGTDHWLKDCGYIQEDTPKVIEKEVKAAAKEAAAGSEVAE